MANNSFIKLDLSGGWYDVLREGIRINTEYATESGIDDEITRHIIGRNSRISDNLERYIREDESIAFFPSEFRSVFWILMENILNLQMSLEVTRDYASECVNVLREYKEILDTIIDEYGLDIDKD